MATLGCRHDKKLTLRCPLGDRLPVDTTQFGFHSGCTSDEYDRYGDAGATYLVLLLLAPLASILAQLIALVLAISFIFSAWLLFRCWQNYSNYQQKIAQEINASEDL